MIRKRSEKSHKETSNLLGGIFHKQNLSIFQSIIWIKRLNKLAIDEWGNIAKYLLNEDFSKLKLYFSDKDYIYLDWLRVRAQEDYFKSKTGMNIEDVCHQKLIKRNKQDERLYDVLKNWDRRVSIDGNMYD